MKKKIIILFNLIFQIENSFAACFFAFLWMLIPSGVIIVAIRSIPYFSRLFAFNDGSMNNFDIFGTIILAPVVETYLLIFLVWFLSQFTNNKMAISIISAVIWGLFHGLNGAIKIFGTAWSFFILTLIYLKWRDRNFKVAYLMTLVPHILFNLMVVMLMKWASYLG